MPVVCNRLVVRGGQLLQAFKHAGVVWRICFEQSPDVFDEAAYEWISKGNLRDHTEALTESKSAVKGRETSFGGKIARSCHAIRRQTG